MLRRKKTLHSLWNFVWCGHHFLCSAFWMEIGGFNQKPLSINFLNSFWEEAEKVMKIQKGREMGTWHNLGFLVTSELPEFWGKVVTALNLKPSVYSAEPMSPSGLLIRLARRCKSCSCAIGIHLVSDLLLHVPFLESSAAFPHQLHEFHLPLTHVRCW